MPITKAWASPFIPTPTRPCRVTYGTVKGYSARDGVGYLPFTTLRGIVEKDTGQKPFDAPVGQLKLIRGRDFGSYYVKRLDSVPVNFLSTSDVTGGNSGSPTLNGQGELVGLLFDGNWESIVADWDFIPAVTRAIHVDIRYVLWIMEHLDGAHRLLTEMGVDAGPLGQGNPDRPRPGGSLFPGGCGFSAGGGGRREPPRYRAVCQRCIGCWGLVGSSG